MSFICTQENFAQTLSENENMQIKQALSQLPKGTFGYIIWMSNREGNWNIYRMEITTGSMKKLTHNDANNRDARISDDGKLIAWDSGGDRKRDVWIMNADGKFQKHIHGGCECHFAPDSSFVYWVMEPGTFGKATLQGEVQQPLYKSDDALPDPYSGANYNYGHTYFPKLSKKMDYLIFGACPNSQHDHDTSDYEIFLMKMDDLKPAWEKPIRLTYDPGTDRWADISVKVDATPPDTPRNLKAESQGQGIKIIWNKSKDPESEVIGYNIYRGTNKGAEELIAKDVKDASYIDYATDAKVKYQYSVSAVNSAELESPKSKSITVATKDAKPITPKNIHISEWH